VFTLLFSRLTTKRQVIAAKDDELRNNWTTPTERLEVLVGCDGCFGQYSGTRAERPAGSRPGARLTPGRSGKPRGDQPPGRRGPAERILVFTDANTIIRPDGLGVKLVRHFSSDPEVRMCLRGAAVFFAEQGGRGQVKAFTWKFEVFP